MKLSKKHTFLLVLILILAHPYSLPVSAVDSFNTASYDLEKGGVQTFYITEADGTITTLTIERIENASKIANGSYKITYDYPNMWKAGFTVNISNNQIVGAYSPFCAVAWGSISESKLTINSFARATYQFIHKTGFLSTATGVVATISENTLSVSKL